MSDLIRVRRGLASQVPALLSGELGWDENTLVFRVGDNSDTPPRVLTDKSSGNFNWGSAVITSIVISGGAINNASIGMTTPHNSKFLSVAIDNGPSNNNNLLQLVSTDVNHGATVVAPNTVYAWAKRVHATQGGLILGALADQNPYAMNMLVYWDANDSVESSGVPLNQVKGTLGKASMMIDFIRHHTNAVQDVESDSNIFMLRARRSGALRPVFFVDCEGDAYFDTSYDNIFDTHEDLTLLNGLRGSVLNPRHELYQGLQSFVQEARPVLEKAGIVTYNPDGTTTMSLKGSLFLTMDTIRQIGERFQALSCKVQALEKLIADQADHISKLMQPKLSQV